MVIISNFHFYHIFHINIEMASFKYQHICNGFTNTYLPYSLHWHSPVHHGLEVGLPSRQIHWRQLCAEEYHHPIIKCDKNTQQATKTNKNIITQFINASWNKLDIFIYTCIFNMNLLLWIIVQKWIYTFNMNTSIWL